MSGVKPVRRHVDDGAGQLTGKPLHILPLHQPCVSHADSATVDFRPDAVPGDLLHLLDLELLHSGRAGRPQGFGNGMVGKLLRQGRPFQHLFFGISLLGVDGGDGEGTLCQSAGLIENHGLRPSKSLQIVTTLHQDAASGRAAYAAEKAERYGDYQRAGAGDHQKNQRPVEPIAPYRPIEKRRRSGQDCQRQRGQQKQQRRRKHHAGGIVPGKAGNEVFTAGLALPGIFHHLQNF
ncbi:hypothetical protein SDC9_77676 [bioreactor metagenome]|uniref:Uncharacterized protein n=1 Tax=bioreactor metagenome TaxID=1076179 RepID=A0A644YXC3_9ZZZZ